MPLTESEIELDTNVMADNLMACIKSLAEVDSTKDADLQALNLETAWKTCVLAQPVHTPYLARWLASKSALLLKDNQGSFKTCVQPAMS